MQDLMCCHNKGFSRKIPFTLKKGGSTMDREKLNSVEIEQLDLSAIEEMEEVISAGQGGSLLLCCWK